MVARARALPARLTPNGRLDALRQVLLFACATYAYSLARGLADGPGVAAAALRHAHEIAGAERALHVFVEPAVQGWAGASGLVAGVASWVYLNAQSTVLIAALVWLYVFRTRSYPFVRDMLVVAMVIALAGYALFPTAPPRLLPSLGFSDPVAHLTGVPGDSGAGSFVDPYAAVPSMHVAVAFILGGTLARVVRRRAARALWLAYPLLMTFVVVVTANHFLLDAALGACTAGVAAVVARRLARRRPAAWGFAPVPAGATA